MIEQEWLACPDPTPMLDFVRDKVGDRKWRDRKLRLFGCACCRRTWHVLTDERSRNAIEASERFADRLITPRQIVAACGAAQKAALKVLNPGGSDTALVEAVQAAHVVAKSAHTIPSRAQLMGWLPDAIVNRVLSCARAQGVPRSDECQHLAALLREVIGNPFRPPQPVPPPALPWNDGTVVRLAQTMYDEWAFDRLPILADALEEAGCDSADILSHCRGPGPHVRGCWVVDAILGKA
jgi:hypothetical protein